MNIVIAYFLIDLPQTVFFVNEKLNSFFNTILSGKK